MAFSHSQSGTYTLILGEIGSDLKLPVMIGSFEAQAIALKLEEEEQKRPMTHDLMINLIDLLDATLTKVEIVKFEAGIFYAELHLIHNGMQKTIDSRTSDAIAIAIRLDIPIYTTREILTKAGIVLKKETLENDESEDSGLENPDRENIRLENIPLEKLQEMLQEEIEQEEFEKASMIQAEINKRKGENIN